MSEFNLVDEKWIQCATSDGNLKELSLSEALINAHELKEIVDPSPLVVVSLHRLLLAILHRNFGPASFTEWQRIWKATRFDAQTLTEYFEKRRHRFNLFDDVRPFYQSPKMERAETHPVLHLAMEVSSGNNATLFDHTFDSQPDEIASSVAARYLIATQAYAIGLGNSYPFYFSDSPLIRGLATMVLGDSLFETLALNLIEYNEDLPFPWADEDLPIWEQEKPAKPSRDGTPVKGYLDYLTWQSRSIHLIAEANPAQVRYCQIQQNLKLPKQEYLDPFKCYRKDKEKGIVPLGIGTDKAVWRDSHALFQTADDSFKRPDIFNWVARVDCSRNNGEIQAKTHYRLNATGLATDTGKAASVLLWRHERLPLPLKYLEDEKLLAKLKEGLEVSEEVAKLLGSGFIRTKVAGKEKKSPSPFRALASEILPKDQNGKADPDTIKALLASLGPTRPYWARLGLAFNELLAKLADDITEDDDEIIYGRDTLPWWAGEVRRAARQAFREATDSLDRSGRMLKAVTKAENDFEFKLNTILKPYKKNQEKGGEA